MHPIDVRLNELGIVLPERSRPAGNYLPACRCDRLLFVSGQFPLENGRLKFAGQIGRDLTPEDGYAAARLACLNALAHVRHETDGWQQLDGIVRIDGHISSASEFHGQPKVLDGASDLLKAVLQDRAGHARTVFGHSVLPLNSSIELVVIACLRPTV
ncbi:endoribonuclease [Sulfurifustis variabilis]|uniref:Endoribonuclease n=1 Tax=Sulfurifustis variabilis TaxID=1675686 RepID=A0A1B4VF88_9GAMM|nr:RidA family protein [Sulfurifustis variabilis]BAU49387.1 endoribonuclease [Sulfurifustis variabilis]